MALKAIFNAMKRKDGYIVKDLDMFLITKVSKEDSDRAFNVNAPSQIGKCLRARYYGRIGTTNDGSIDGRLQRIFDNGSHVHLRIQNYLTKQGMLLLDEVPVLSTRYNIQGHTDGILDVGGGELVILEIKSMKQEQFIPLKGAKEAHKYQGLTYVYCIESHRLELQRKYPTREKFEKDYKNRMKEYASFYSHLKSGKKHTKEEKIEFQSKLHDALDNILIDTKRPITKVAFLYENKNTQELKEYIVSSLDLDGKEIIEGILTDCDTLNKAVKSKKEPPREGKSKSDQCCRWCDFKIACWN